MSSPDLLTFTFEFFSMVLMENIFFITDLAAYTIYDVVRFIAIVWLCTKMRIWLMYDNYEQNAADAHVGGYVIINEMDLDIQKNS